MDEVIKNLRVDRIDAKEVATLISKEHPTHQASVIRNMLEVVKQYHNAVKFSDLRNKAAVEASLKVAEMEDLFIPYI
jgi:hypothetical protein